MGRFTISMAIFNCYVSSPKGKLHHPNSWGMMMTPPTSNPVELKKLVDLYLGSLMVGEWSNSELEAPEAPEAVAQKNPWSIYIKNGDFPMFNVKNQPATGPYLSYLSHGKDHWFSWFSWLQGDSSIYGERKNDKRRSFVQWIGLRENPQETMDFPIKYGGFPVNFPLNQSNQRSLINEYKYHKIAVSPPLNEFWVHKPMQTNAGTLEPVVDDCHQTWLWNPRPNAAYAEWFPAHENVVLLPWQWMVYFMEKSWKIHLWTDDN